jgi:hypothetical protein
MSVTVNGESVTVPENGSVERDFTSPDGSTSVHVSANQSSDGNSHSSTHTSTQSSSVTTNTQNSSTVIQQRQRQ